jgi:hypothetical protein
MMSERLKLIELNIGVTEDGLYCTTYVTPAGSELIKTDSEFKGLLDTVVAAVAQALNTAVPDDCKATGKARAHGPGAEVLAKALGEQGVDVEVGDKPTVH